MTTRLRGRLAAATLTLLGVTGLAVAQDEKGKDQRQMGEGVIVKVEPIGVVKESKDGEKSTRKVKITVNTAAVWRDFVRDQADFAKRPDAKKGEESVATKGQPLTESETIIAEVGPETHLVLRYRSSTDEADKGSRTIAKAEQKDGSPASDEVKAKGRDEKAPKFHVADLEPGLFVEVESRNGKAHSLTVLKPVGGSATPASVAQPVK